jgi:hypothetical protein
VPISSLPLQMIGVVERADGRWCIRLNAIAAIMAISVVLFVDVEKGELQRRVNGGFHVGTFPNGLGVGLLLGKLGSACLPRGSTFAYVVHALACAMSYSAS